MQTLPFMVNERYYVVIGYDLIARNISFLNQFQPDYFNQTGKAIFSFLTAQQHESQEATKYLPALLRTVYGHAVETFFSILYACLQAPFCVVAWLQKYKLSDIRQLAEKTQNITPFENYKVAVKRNNWEEISKIINVFKADSEHIKRDNLEGFHKFWTILAKDLLDEKFQLEYNHIKHGFRISHGGFHLSIGKEISRYSNHFLL